ncbi:MAG: hypothetical protein EXS13_14855, partial [Planctomycetes bacterium]|nr:hypothetical protein [Planctomycetota bacterium]
MNFSFRHDGPAVFVVGTGRCGTTLLTDLIQGERISCLKEMVHYNLLRPFDKLATEPGAPLRERFRRVWRRLRGRLAGPFAIDRRLKELL